ncbi:hypothetical protein [Brevundimonas sp.]|uniref:hypothetical protein n=1 Tax=Brevundimonas sp. TaxID=1871086 RepID=UPI002D66311C|nr:hypothetical protein [Brevundimonas sp.]HYC96983.1 hypothetical protein [Brevundimonas sp.]
MLRTIRSVAVVSAVALAALGSMALDYPPEYTGYTYDWYHDAAKTQYGGTVTDSGCGGWGEHRWVQRAYVPSGYYDAYPAFYCGEGGMEPI